MKSQRGGWDIEDSLDELAQLSLTAGLEVVGQTWQRLDRFNPATLVGSGKLEELKELCLDLDADVLLFDDELTPRQQRNLEEALGDEIKILDRTALILDIFAQHARTKEGHLQVALAQYEYRLPRLTRAWLHLARQAGGGGARGGVAGVGLRGPGETQLEVDRREISRRMARLRKDLEQVRQHRALHRRQRKRQSVPVVAIVGYTNAGKSTLLNALSGANVLVEDLLFATLDPTTRRIPLPRGREALFSDTVGFIQRLPTQLVAAFRATLEEINEADAIIHVLDVTQPTVHLQYETVMDTLQQIGAADCPIILALNKVDLLPDADSTRFWQEHYPGGLAVSAAEGTGLDELLNEVEQVLSSELIYLEVRVPYELGGLSALFHSEGTGVQTSHGENGTELQGYLPRRWLEQFRPYLV